VRRLAGRLGFSAEDDADRVERDLMALLSREEWIFAGHALILHGRRVCQARLPRCSECGLAGLCPRRGVERSA
jgi:endonuclease III